jgi:hypothetical protein
MRAAPNVASGAAWKMGCLADDWAALETEATLTDQMDQRHPNKAYDYRGSENPHHHPGHFNAAYSP